MTVLARDRMAERLAQDLLGPFSADEILTDRPTQRYTTGILYPVSTPIGQDEDQDEHGMAVNERDDSPSTADVSGVPLYAALKPSVAGMSFAVEPSPGEVPALDIDVTCALYEQIAVNDDGHVVDGEPLDRQHERWKRVPHEVSATIQLTLGEQEYAFDSQGLPGLNLYVLVKRFKNVLTVTTAISNRRERGDSRAYDEAQHFFQVKLRASVGFGGVFAPRPSRRAQTDEDSRTAALIYRDIKEHVVGHTCSATGIRGSDGAVKHLETTWLPTVVVQSVSDRGDPVFEGIRKNPATQPLKASWLAAASATELQDGLTLIVDAYEEWIERERSRIGAVPNDLRSQAVEHMKRCQLGAGRMRQGVLLLADESKPEVREAFQLAQRAMAMQFAWGRNGEELHWRPFQLAFQLLTLASLESRVHPDRETMDLLWFPTGGGKTEAYLALAAFTILLRRLRRHRGDDGAGVAVLMRYTLRLLTVQQFQRAAALIFACELIRRAGGKAGEPMARLGSEPIGIGLWVGQAATPLTLKDAIDLTSDDYGTYKQLTTCPACGENLVWSVSRAKSSVKCPAEAAACVLASVVPELPVWTIDEEVYKHAPSLVIGTVDKFAQVVRKLDTRLLFGDLGRRSPPDLIIQDELHLISGPLGSITGLFEVVIDEFCRTEEGRVKIIGSTATIRRAREQIRALFDRGTYQFPAPGLDFTNSGFAMVDPGMPARRYLGVTTAGRSATYVLQALVASLLQSATESDATEEERDFYWTQLTYFNSLRELGRALVLMQDDVPISIKQFALRRDETARKIEAPAELTSRVSSYEIRGMLDRLAVSPPDPEAVDLLLASNMISVGMDIPRLGLMVVNAQPKSMSEYIQATSRVGRGRVPGLVVTMYNSMRARDRSHYETFETWHQSLYRDVEASSVTPFASRAQDKALHAVLVALVRHKVKGMDRSPVLTSSRRNEVEKVASVIVHRVARVDRSEQNAVTKKLNQLIDEWASRQDLQRYWDDYGKSTTLMMSAEQFAARDEADVDRGAGGLRSVLWSAPNSMREVEPGTPYTLRHILRTEES